MADIETEEKKTEETEIFEDPSLEEILGEVEGKKPSPEETPEDKESKKTQEKEVEEPEKKPDEKTEEEKAKLEAEEKAKKEAEEKSSFDWESEDNIYKKKTTDLEKRLKDTRDYDTRVNQENVDLKKSLETINKKLDGTYVEGEETTPSTEDIQAKADYEGRMKASNALAVEKYGKEHIDKMLYQPDSPFQILNRNPSIHHRVANAEAPVLEAIKVIEEAEFFNKYGKDIKGIPDKIKSEFEVDLRKQITKEFQDKLKLKKEQPEGLGGLKNEALEEEKEQKLKVKSTAQLFDD